TVREHLANEILDFLPEMTRTGIQQSNMQLRRRHFERIMSVQASEGYAECENLDAEIKVQEPIPESSLSSPLEAVADSDVDGDHASTEANQ
ncbi:MAG: chaperonin family protein RbcX, partial [Pseudanabaena sp.]